jgi:hypothetical protein
MMLWIGFWVCTAVMVICAGFLMLWSFKDD